MPLRLTPCSALLTVGALLAACSSSSSNRSSTANASTAQAQPAQIFLQDAPPVTITDDTGAPVFEMRELWLTITAATLERGSGPDVPLSLAAVGSGVVLDVMTLDDASVLLALGSFPADAYEEIELTVTAAEMVGIDLLTNQPATIQVGISSPEFAAEFDPGPVFLDPALPTTIVIDWQPAVDASSQGGATSYTLRDEVHAFVPGASPGPYHRDSDLSGQIVAVDCAAGVLTIAPVSSQARTMDVQLFPTTQYLDDDGTPLPNGCADLVVGQEVEIDGLAPAQPGGLFEATVVELEGGSELEGVVANLTTNANGFIEFDLRQGSAIVAHVVTDANTEYDYDVQGQTQAQQAQQTGQATAAAVQNGVAVEVEGTLGAPSTPPTLTAEEVEIR